MTDRITATIRQALNDYDSEHHSALSKYLKTIYLKNGRVMIIFAIADNSATKTNLATNLENQCLKAIEKESVIEAINNLEGQTETKIEDIYSQIKTKVRIIITNEIEEDAEVSNMNIQHHNVIYSDKHKQQIKNKTAIPGVDKVILVISGKGGVGKSIVTSSIAIALSQQKHKVSIVDADIHGPSIPRIFGIEEEPIIQNNLFIPPEIDKIKIMSVGSLVDSNQALVWRGPMLSKMLHRIIQNSEWRHSSFLRWHNTNYLIVDTPPGTGDIHLNLMQNYEIHGAVVVSTPQQISIDDSHKSIDMLNKMGINMLGIVENMGYIIDGQGNKIYPFGKEKVQEYANSNHISFLGTLPIVAQLCENADNGTLGKFLINTKAINPELKDFNQVISNIILKICCI